ncbi:hypothetical protein DSO57_1001560 [Entomophthora muscae]|uniref:Uncharacterized protein n=1 Tax=Entomophthora muscae TaxID=34485 RepID=A0ACC2SAZ8_9FUNG|nr:hypothetical protein DSO57_1001560 [Entomophthora muscae]
MLKWYLVQVIPTSSHLQASDLAIKALQHLKPNNLKLVPTQEQLVKFIGNKCIAANPPPPKASDVLLELMLTHELKQLSSGKCFLLHDNGPSAVTVGSIMPGIVCPSKKAQKAGKPVSKFTKLTDLNQTVD